ncbi:MAG: YraN family protein [candidate division SR1 bacterium]|nr:YraN family protein [candidate division SR1 bacterium]
MNISNIIGKEGEGLVKQWYLINGYKFVVANFQYFRSGIRGQNGEIDLIFIKQNKVYLIEVKSRKSQGLGSPLDTINKSKMVFLYKTYQHFLFKYPQYQKLFVQFDAAVVIDGKISILPNAYHYF